MTFLIQYRLRTLTLMANLTANWLGHRWRMSALSLRVTRIRRRRYRSSTGTSYKDLAVFLNRLLPVRVGIYYTRTRNSAMRRYW